MRELQETAGGEAPFPIKYYTVQPNRWTFQSDKIRRWVKRHLQDRVLNACCGKTKLSHGGPVVRNDLNTEMDADCHYDVCEIASHFQERSFDAIIHDPPFSEEQAESAYDGVNIEDEAAAMEQYDRLLRPGGVVIKFGFSTTTMPGEKDYVREEVAIFNTLGRMNDWLGTVDKKVNHELGDYL